MTITKIEGLKCEVYDRYGIDMIDRDKVTLTIFGHELTIEGQQAKKLKAQAAAELAAAIIANLDPEEIRAADPHELEELPARAVELALTALALCR